MWHDRGNIECPELFKDEMNWRYQGHNPFCLISEEVAKRLKSERRYEGTSSITWEIIRKQGLRPYSKPTDSESAY